MELINNRYKIIQSLETNQKQYVAIDLFKGEQKVFLYIVDDIKLNKEFINYCITYFYEISSLIHPNILSVYHFNIIETIDDQPMKKTKYYYTTEYVNNEKSLKVDTPFDKNKLLLLYRQIFSGIEFLHFHGMIYKFISLETLFIQESEDGFTVKLLDLITIKKKEIDKKYREFSTDSFIAPEVVCDFALGNYTDIYSLGGILYYFYTLEVVSASRLTQKINYFHWNGEKSWEITLFKLIQRMIHTDLSDRFHTIYQVNEEIVKLYGIEEKFENQKQLEKLNFKTPIIGRDKELQQILSLQKSNKDSLDENYKSLVLIHGDEGIGKTRLIKEVLYRVRLEKHKTFNTRILSETQDFYSVIPKLIRQMLSLATPNIIEKYYIELLRLTPEIGVNKNITYDTELSEDKEILRLYDRVTNFIIDLSLKHPIMITLDDIHLADVSVVRFVDYFHSINTMKKASVTIIATFNKENHRYTEIEEYIKRWSRLDYILDIKLGRLTVEETAKLIKHILGCSKEPLDFATEVMKDTEGNPGVIEELLEELYAQNLLTVDYYDVHKGWLWRVTEDDYSKIKLSKGFDQALLKQIDGIDDVQKKVLKIMAVFKTSVSLEIITKLLGEDENYINHIDRLVALKVLDEKLEDWGYAYSFHSKQLKYYIYYNIDKEEKRRLHVLISEILEKLYKKEDRENKEELIYHLLQSNQRDKAIHYCIEAGDGMCRLRIYTEALTFYENAYRLLGENDERKLQILIKLGNTYQRQGKSEKAIHYYREAVYLAEAEGAYKALIDIKNKIGYIYLLKNQLKEAINRFEENIEMAENHSYFRGLLEAGYLLSTVYISTRRIKKAEFLCNTYLNLAYSHNSLEYIGLFLNQKGVIKHLRSDALEAIRFFKDSIGYFEKANKTQEIAGTLNNIGNVFVEYFQNSENARKYYDKALKIAQQYNDFEMMIKIYNSIAVAYILEEEYEKAIELLTKNTSLSLNFPDHTTRFLLYIYFTQCYLNTAEYNKAYSYLIKAKEELQLYSEEALYFEMYYEVETELYMAMGAYEEALESCRIFFTDFNKSHPKRKLKMKLMKFFASYCLNEEDADILLDIMKEYKKTFYSKDIGELLFYSTLYYCYKKDAAKVQQILQRDRELKDVTRTKYSPYKRRYIEALVEDSPKEKIRHLEEIASEKCLEGYKELKWKIYQELGEAYYQLRDDYHAINYYLKAIYTIKMIFLNVPEKFKEKYILSEKKYDIKLKLSTIEASIKNKPLPDLSNSKVDLDSYFKISHLQQLFKNPDFYEKAIKQYEKNFPVGINSIEELLSQLVYHTNQNLDLVLKLAAKKVLAKKAIIVSAYNHQEEIARFGEKSDIEKITDILESVSKKQKGLIIDNIKSLIESDKEFLHYERNAFICLPIFQKGEQNKNIENDLRRENVKKILGYLYMETNEVFHNFTLEGYEACEKLLPLTSILLDNYYLKISSFVDKLTGVYTRKYFEHMLLEEFEKAKNQGGTFSIIMCDIDHFKKINDTYGHQQGDFILTKVGKVLMKNIRKTDIVGRYGGEEFIILLPDTTKQEAYKVAEKMRKQFEKLELLENKDKITLSYGIASYMEEGMHKEAIIEKADQALYAAKERGRNQTVVWEAGIGFTDKRIDKLAGIVKGNIVEDQRNVLVLMEAIELIGSTEEVANKIFILLGRLIETLEAQEGILFKVENARVVQHFNRRRFCNEWVDEINYNQDLVKKALHTAKGEYLIDWQDIKTTNILTGTPNWKSIIIVPILFCGEIKGILYLSVPLMEKEFDFQSYNLAKTTSSIIAPILNTMDVE
ncbi:diguanylate cyclase [Clostridium formicaceticum]|uniref:Diguanylate cyclase DosC n=1 Tax=Clostridium formicaceticum TaxID=1497 RepID=A0AAC9RL75_9CLOT|nr:diguanylate cyclase [Clostridium formicaceticum]AOY76645.1 hypothetical protein BJL90_12685 [Clostridium formicaceticum]ARE87068.1 Diguanylate cyclase DosC [Clostridium formicaceticum]